MWLKIGYRFGFVERDKGPQILLLFTITLSGLGHVKCIPNNEVVAKEESKTGHEAYYF